MKRQNKNFIFNVGYQLVMYLFPLVTSMYISRALGAERLGVYAYVNSIVTICGMFGMLGIANYGNREVAKSRDDRTRLSEVFSSVYSLQLLMSGVVILLYGAAILLLPVSYPDIFAIQLLHLLSVALDVSWLFFGLEKFKVTLTRNFLIKVVAFALILLLVRDPGDLRIYSWIMCGSSVVSQLFLWILIRREVDFRPVGLRRIVPHMKSCLVLFIPVLAYSIYRIMDKTMLGAMCEKSQLGFYENAERIINIPIMVIAALGTVMMPHMAHIMQGSGDEYKQTIRFSMKLAMSIATFSTLGLMVVGRDLAVALFGAEYAESGRLILLLATTVLASAWANVIRTQYLIPRGQDKPYVISTLVGAVINLVCNFIFIPQLQAIGACIGTIAAECSIVLIQTVWVRNLEIGHYVRSFLWSLAKAAGTMTVVWIVGWLIPNLYARLIVRLMLAMGSYLLLNRSLILHEFLGLRGRRKHHN